MENKDIQILTFKGHINNVGDTLKEVNKIQSSYDGAVIQLMDARAIAGYNHIKHGIYHAFKAFDRGENLANDLGIEICLRTSAQRQISKALDILGLKEGNITICGVLINTPLEGINQLSELFTLEDKQLSIDKDYLIKVYNIPKEELSVYSIEDILIDKITRLIVEV